LNALDDVRATLRQPDMTAVSAIDVRATQVLRPAGALARLDHLAAWLAGWQGTTHPRIERPVALIFAADHGVVAAGVSAYPIEITAAMLAAFRAGASSVNVMARQLGATVEAIDVGVGRPTADFRHEPAMNAERFTEAVTQGRRAVERCEGDVIVIGEMGIGNTTAAAAVCASLCGGKVDDWVGRATRRRWARR